MTEKQRRVLVVDDEPNNLQLIREILNKDYRLAFAPNGTRALEVTREVQPDLILLDIMMPGMDGYETCRQLKTEPKTMNIPVMFVTTKSNVEDERRGFEIGGVDYITKPVNPERLKARVRTHLELKRHNDNLEEMVRERTRELELTQEVTIESMAAIAECRDPETGGHIKRTQNYVRSLAIQVKDHPNFNDFLKDGTINLLYKSAPLHDIGKVAIEDRILLKPGKLTDEEFDRMKNHTIHGRDAIHVAGNKLGSDSFLRHAEIIAYTHHEKWDGSGYPQGLRGADIPISGRLMAIADVYDALISRRVYKEPFSHTKAVTIILEGKSSHFDPDLVDAFMGIQEDFRQIAMQFADFEEEKEALAKPYQP